MWTALISDVGNVFLWLASIFIVIWVVQYTILAPWWRDFVGVTMVGEALCLLAIFIPSLIQLADPHEVFVGTRWYLYLSVFVVAFSCFFMGTRIVVWDRIRYSRNGKNARAREQIGARRKKSRPVDKEA